MPLAPPVLLWPSLQRYAWGDPSFIPKLLGLPVTGQACAEAWFGAHPLSPSIAETPSGSRPLDRIIRSAGAELLGAEVHERFGELPYLLKVLAAARPLSIQVHPNRRQAEVGFEREEAAKIPVDAPHRRYRDRAHKPELMVALTDFFALCGFRPEAEVRRALEGLPELQGILPPLEPGTSGLEAWLTEWFGLADEVVRAPLEALVARLQGRDAEEPFEPHEPEHWALRAHRELSTDGRPDRGLLFVFILELVHLKPGQGMFLPSGVPHSYLHGAGVELMANSDNVLRAGLTSKPIDPGELMRIVRFDAGRPPVVEPVDDGTPEESVYPIPAAEIELRRLHLGPGQTVERTADGPETLLVLGEPGTLPVTLTAGPHRLELSSGRACLVPSGAQYVLHSSVDVTVFRAKIPARSVAGDFRGRSPTRLAFGTSGLRGRVEDITDLEAYINTRGFLDYLVAVGDAVPGTPVAVGGDLRPSTERIARAVFQAIDDAGLQARNCGRLPTPALSAYAIERRWPSIMVTGSHIPFDRNGIKFNKSSGEVLKEDEPAILAAVERQRRLEYARSAETSRFDDEGAFRSEHRPTLPPETDDAARAYVRRYLDAYAPDALAGLRVVLYEHSAVGREVVAEVLRGLGAEVHATGRASQFIAIDTEAISDARLADLQQLADEAGRKWGPIDAIVSTDGDSDRPMVCGVDEQGRVRFVGGDVLGALVADALNADAVAVPVSATDLIDRFFEDRDLRVARTRIGSPWVIAAMAELPGERRVGWEANGGFLTASSLALEHGALPALPTRDAVLPIVAALSAARRRGASLVDLVRALPERHGRSGLLDGVPPASSRELARYFGAPSRFARAARFDGDVVYVTRPADPSEEIAADSDEREVLEQCRARLREVFGPSRGFGRVHRIDFLDGIRVTFDNGDIAHVRPSGNAPQLRIYAVADAEARAEAIVNEALREPSGALRQMLAMATGADFVAKVRKNIDAARRLFSEGQPPALVGTVSGSRAAQGFWQQWLDRVKTKLRAETAISLHEDLPVNQAFGLLLTWQRLRDHHRSGRGALVAFVFGEGSRATPFTEAESGQKPAIESFVAVGTGPDRRFASTVELALEYFAPVESHLRRSGFDGLVVKWGDEIQIPTRDLSGTDDRFRDADVVRFVSMRTMTEDDAANKDWVGVDAEGNVTAFIPRRPLAQMSALADRGLLQRDGDHLVGGINLGSIAVSRPLLEALWEEFSAEVNDPGADRKTRPDLDPQLFTALTIAVIRDEPARDEAWRVALADSEAMRKLDHHLPDALPRLRRALDRFEAAQGRPPRLVAMDFGDQYWGDIGQHRQMFELFTSLNARTPEGEIARALAGLTGPRDDFDNHRLGDVRLGPDVHVRNSVLIDAHVLDGEVVDSVLIGTRCGHLVARGAFDVGSVCSHLELAPRAGAYKVSSEAPVWAGPGERITTVCLPDDDYLLRVDEDTDLRDRAVNYDQPILGNALSFADAHRRAVAADPQVMQARRAARRAEIERTLSAGREASAPSGGEPST